MQLQRTKEKRKCSLKVLLAVGMSSLMMLYVSTLYTIVLKRRAEDAALLKTLPSSSNIDGGSASDQLDQPLNLPALYLKSRQQLPTHKKQPKQQQDTPILKAYIEKVNQAEWKIKPLPARKTKAKELVPMEFKKVSSCTKLPEQWPIDDDEAPTNKDPFLPWIHDVFPTADGKFIQFVAQNRRRCQTGTRKTKIKKFFQPNVALFQHVPVKRIALNEQGKPVEGMDGIGNGENSRYMLTSHDEADKDGVETRFICRFKPSMEETLSVFNFNYDFNTLRKSYKATFTEEGFDNHMIWSSQLLFRCPVPPSLQEEVRLGTSVINDYASLFVDLIPIRTPPRYGPPTTYLPPRLFSNKNSWNVKKEWGNKHILPKIEDSGRWENIPICKPSLMTYADEALIQSDTADDRMIQENEAKMAKIGETGEKKHELIACTWTSAAFKTRGGRTHVSDGEQRLYQWLTFNKLAGFDHVYIYDNSGSFSDTMSLKGVTDLFPGFVTRVNWPAKVCNNNRGNVDNKGERSSQYAADASCRLRFGAHSEWLGSFDTDEYLVPLEKYSDLKQLLHTIEKEKGDIKMLKFQSKRSKPRIQFLNTTSPATRDCNEKEQCFDPAISNDQSFLEVYNCNLEKPPRKVLQPAEKLIYKPDFVLQFFVHYPAVTALSAMGKPEAQKKGLKWFTRYDTRKHNRFVDESSEATMLHTKAIVSKETKYFHSLLSSVLDKDRSAVGIQFPSDVDDPDSHSQLQVGKDLFYSNCFPVEWIEKHWGPKLNEELKKHRFQINT